MFADSNFLQCFSFTLEEGDPNTVLRAPFTALLSRQLARKYFGSADPTGRQLSFNGRYTFTITGVLENPPSNSSIHYGMIASLSSFALMDDHKEQVSDNQLRGGGFTTYLLLQHPGDLAGLESAFARLQHQLDPDNKTPDRIVATPLRQLHLSDWYGSQENLKYLSVFPLVAALILLLALTNYISLSTAKAMDRAREIGMRKVLGAGRKAIAVQFFLESALYTVFAFAIAYTICLLFEQRFFHYLQLPVDHHFLWSTRLLLSYAGLLVATAIGAAAYPAMLLSGFQPIRVLYGKQESQTGALLVRKGITLLQVSIAVALIICGIVINRQVFFFRNTYTGIDRENVLSIPFPDQIGSSYPAFRSSIEGLSGVQEVAINHYSLYSGYDMWMAKSRNSDAQTVSLPVYNVDNHFIHLLGLRWSVPPDDTAYAAKRNQIVLNESAVKAFHLQPGRLHQLITLGNKNQIELAGILRDFNFESLQKPIAPLGLFVAADSAAIWSSLSGVLLARISPHTNLPTLIGRIKHIYERYEHTTPFSFTFLDESFEKMYRAEERLSQIFAAFITITISIAVLGLFGLATFLTGRRIREIGIRKVLGASVPGIIALLSRDFFRLAMIASLIGCPVAYLCMRQWLQSFAFRITIQWWMLAGGALLAMVIALATIGMQAFRAALTSPVNSLRSG